ncbi:uncharacterized protein A1O9_13137, partial [Exophiala aquamarina CBS 119918]
MVNPPVDVGGLSWWAPSSPPPLPNELVNQHFQNYMPILPAGPLPPGAVYDDNLNVTLTETATKRRKLTNDERRQMCIDAEENPTMRQTQIGAKYNVERSTVSKILRQKDKYINLNSGVDGSSPEKKPTAKVSPVEQKPTAKALRVKNTLINWVRASQEKGTPISDEDLEERAGAFCSALNDKSFVASADWLEKFKSEHGLTAPQGDNDSTSRNTSPAFQPQTLAKT